MKKILPLLFMIALVFSFPSFTFAEKITVNGKFEASGGKYYFVYSDTQALTKPPYDEKKIQFINGAFTIDGDLPLNGQELNCSIDGGFAYHSYLYCTRGYSPTAQYGLASTTDAGKRGLFNSLVFKTDCTSKPREEALGCWINAAFNWATIGLVTSSVASVIAAGIIYMVSMGNPERLKKAKSMIVGAFSGLLVIILAKFFLTTVIGVSWLK